MPPPALCIPSHSPHTREVVQARATGAGVHSTAFLDVSHPEPSPAATPATASSDTAPQTQTHSPPSPTNHFPQTLQRLPLQARAVVTARTGRQRPPPPIRTDTSGSGSRPEDNGTGRNGSITDPRTVEVRVGLGRAETSFPTSSSVDEGSRHTAKLARSRGTGKSSPSSDSSSSSRGGSSSMGRKDVYADEPDEDSNDLERLRRTASAQEQRQRQRASSSANRNSAENGRQHGRSRERPFGISSSVTDRSDSGGGSSSSSSSSPADNTYEDEDGYDHASNESSPALSSDSRPTFSSSILSNFEPEGDPPSEEQRSTRKDTTPQGLRTQDGRARLLLSLTSTAGGSAACLARVLRQERVAVLQSTGHQPALVALKTLALATAFLHQHNSSLTFIPYCDSVWDLTGVSFGVLPNYTMHVFERQMLPAETSLLVTMRTALHVFEFSMHVSRTWQDKCAVVLDQAHHFADVLYTTLLQDHRQHQESLRQRSLLLQQQLELQRRLGQRRQPPQGHPASQQQRQQQQQPPPPPQQWQASLADPRLGLDRLKQAPEGEVSEPLPIVVSVDLSLALTALASLSLAQRRLMLEGAPFSLQVSVYRNTTAPRMDGRNGFVFVIRHSTAGIQAGQPTAPVRAPARARTDQTSSQDLTSDVSSGSRLPGPDGMNNTQDPNRHEDREAQPGAQSPQHREGRARDERRSSGGGSDAAASDPEVPYFSRERPGVRGLSDRQAADDEQWDRDGEDSDSDVPPASMVQPSTPSTQWESAYSSQVEQQMRTKEFIRLPRKHYQPRRGRPQRVATPWKSSASGST
ncbi:MAG: hypothetical protein WDW36_007215 [Sanguina aurantia]